jgi:putative endonuclease
VTRSRRDLGDFGERLAAAHLESKGYRIVERNFRIREGEVDVIAERDGTLVFVEVRTRRGAAMGTAAESVTPTKAARLVVAAQAYLQTLESPPAEQRIDVIAVTLAPDGRVLSVEQIEGAVEEGPG